ncbi:YtzH-like family protein [Bacillus alkalicellulosilyticus]|uniref:YtzH-like family protein n=1 Tax=Alkalihalobacterium alkalicellulosilyticum TaxID=1912214 RepID=UPI001482535D|nr:YtzH-like family protein [Bacillus alkalicellulosilyticus]
MPINQEHKLSLLTDILKNQMEQHQMTTDEYDQISRLLSSLLNESALSNTQLEQTFMAIQQHHYGNNSGFSDTDVEQWLQTIEQYKTQ